ncbi:uncharacterized protein PV09_06540 [Verruconis gallopava]|uniref:Uncharacterized protein n=1 Tax=Verruconis gallopava TaxID=253628 RepID=A0A0D2A5P9_9PEZI|nr:uncharacterized protein PV09_06540 [Verruconis gallopava]KIW02038.1 hypothetical protein PV09_06540 [Verruconis gallopava]
MTLVNTSDSHHGESFHRIRTASSHDSTELAHPMPDLQSLQGAYLQNVERLEERAERMSVGSDLGEEIRKLQQEQKLSDSSRASMYSANAAEQPPRQQRSRNVSTSSYANSIVEVNTAARSGGYSPYSPMGSLRSGSWSQVSRPVSNPARSISRSSFLGMMSTPEMAESEAVTPNEAQQTSNNTSIQHTPRPESKSETAAPSDSTEMEEDTRAKRMKRLSTGRLPSEGSFSVIYNQLVEENRKSMDISGIRVASDTSFTDIYDQIASEIKNSLNTSVQGAQEREMKRQSLNQPPQLQPAFAESPKNTTKPFRLSQTPPPLPPQHRQLPKVEPQDDFGINFSFTTSTKEPQYVEDRRPSEPLQIHVPHDERDDNHSDRPSTARSQDTYQQADGLFQDFDGTHYAPSMLSRHGSLRDTSRGSAFPVDNPNRSSVLKDASQPESMASLVPPPEDGMVYYPAPVPRMLNLPPKISQNPSAAAIAKRRTQFVNAIPEDARKSAYWLPQGGGQRDEDTDARASKLNLAALPPQLRASVFFDSGAQRQDIEVRDQSAMRTLDDLLDASALAPVSAFTDHPIVGKIGANVYKKSPDARASTLNLPQAPTAKKERKSSFLGLRRSSVGSEDALGGGNKRSSTRGKLVKSNSAVLDDSALARGPNGEIGAGGNSGRTTPALDPNGVYGDLRDEDANETQEAGGVQLEEESDEEYVGAPTTLLAELEMRKREQKNRNKTAYTAFPDGMHATLLELDDVAQLKKAKRKKKRVALAWEDPAVRAADEMGEADDDDVPLGVLYSNNEAVAAKIKEQGMAEGRPLGLLEKKELEDNEPLSRRMLRLRGINPNSVRPPPVAITNAEGESETESEHEGETLGQRLKRLRDKKALDEAITEVEGRPISETFSAEMLSQLGVESKDEKKATQEGLHSRNVSVGQISTGSAPKSPGGGILPPSRANATTPGAESEEETLGQRRARLQREALQAGMQQRRQSQMTLNGPSRMSTMLSPAPMEPNMAPGPSRTPPLRASLSMADLLAANPTGKHDARKVSNELLLATAPQGSLLAQDAEKQEARKARMRLSSAEVFQTQRPEMQRHFSGVTAKSGGMYVNQQQMHGMWQQNMMQQNAMQQNGYGSLQTYYGMNGYGAVGNANMFMGAYGGYQTPAYGGMHPGFGGMALQQEAFLDQKTRSRVDAWRQSIVP